MRILIIEDNSPSAFLLASLCEGAGREIEVASTMRKAWEMIRSRVRYDLIFLDLGLTDSMPHESLQLIPSLKTLSFVVIVTGYADDEEVRKAATAADGFLSKDDPEFADLVQRQLEAVPKR